MSASAPVPGSAEPLNCELCQRVSVLQFHATGSDVLDRAECRRTGGDGMWLCSICEEGVHRWMAEHPGEGSAQAAVDEMVQRLLSLIDGTPRKYRRQRRTTDTA
ncbi:hypothetical protein [Citricoccus sp. I39-566]|uniref:hypothetical protein n=1 Tax=Citricoccus sp. I39-566 TaxID=3073268 RepID=UPI00286C2E2C|nr:hypothetical protein [Citricoccus sp. I39-566]WMY80037.1 hypothetical protein RE421_16615 [Citricoccus sp. I39-566]